MEQLLWQVLLYISCKIVCYNLCLWLINFILKTFFFLNSGRVNGVVKQLADSYPKIVGVACAAHRLALACKDSSNHVKYMATFRDHLQELHLFFRNSANRTATLKAASITLGVSDLKMKVIVIWYCSSYLLCIHNVKCDGIVIFCLLQYSVFFATFPGSKRHTLAVSAQGNWELAEKPASSPGSPGRGGRNA